MRAVSRSVPVFFALSLAAVALAAEAPDVATPNCPAGQTYWAPAEGCVTLPVLKTRVEPDLVATDPGADAEFLVLALVQRDGHVGNAKVLATLPETAVIDAGTSRKIVNAVRQWVFKPGKDTTGVPADMYLTLRVRLLFED
jgi:hypothetical protein